MPVGRLLDDQAPPAGVARRLTDVPLDAANSPCRRRVGLGSYVAGHGSGDIFLAVSTGHRVPRFASGRVTVELLADDDVGELFTATVDATEEAVTNALFVADTVVGRDGNTAPGLPVDRILDSL